MVTFFFLLCDIQLQSLFLISAAPDGSPIVARPNSVIPHNVIFVVHELVNSGSTLEDAVTYIRGKLVQAGKIIHLHHRALKSSGDTKNYIL